MRTAAGLAIIAVAAIGSFAVAGLKELFAAAPPSAPLVADAPPSPEVAKLITDLGAPDHRVREKAGATLEAKGDQVLPDLRRAIKNTESPEISRRLSVLIRKMEHDRLISPRRVTLSLKDRTLKQVFEEISKQTGYKIEYQHNGVDQKHSFEFDKAPFWQAVDKVAETANLSIYADYGDDTIRVNSYSDAHNPYVAYAGPFRLVPTGINSNKSVQLSGINRRGFAPRPQEHVNLSFQIQSEPKNPILGTLQAEAIKAIDETGASLLPPRNDNNNSYRRSGYYSGGYRGHNAYANLSLVRGDRDAVKIKELKGKIGIILLAGTVPEVEIADPLKVKEKKLVGRNVEVDYNSTTEANGQYSVSLTVKKLGQQDPNNVDYNWSNNLWQKIELIDDQGNRFRTYGPNSQNNNGFSVSMTIMYGPDNRGGQQVKMGKPAKLIVNEWLQVTHEVQFEFKDIPLP
jgi:hypothetical protein